MKWGKDFFMVCTVILGLGIILQQAILGYTIKMLMDNMIEIEEVALQQGGWVYFPPLDKDFKK